MNSWVGGMDPMVNDGKVYRVTNVSEEYKECRIDCHADFGWPIEAMELVDLAPSPPPAPVEVPPAGPEVDYYGAQLLKEHSDNFSSVHGQLVVLSNKLMNQAQKLEQAELALGTEKIRSNQYLEVITQACAVIADLDPCNPFLEQFNPPSTTA